MDQAHVIIPHPRNKNPKYKGARYRAIYHYYYYEQLSSLSTQTINFNWQVLGSTISEQVIKMHYYHCGRCMLCDGIAISCLTYVNVRSPNRRRHHIYVC